MSGKVSITLLLFMLTMSMAACHGAGQVDAGHVPTALERQIVQEVNRARTQPRQYATFLIQRHRFYVGRALRRPGKVIEVTQEGVAALDEAMRFLRTAPPVPALSVARGLALGAWDHVRDQGPEGTTGHQGGDGSQPSDRASRHGQWQGSIGENIAYGHDSARDVVIGFIVDDGVPSRGHRQNLFKAAWRVTGVACGSHKVYHTMCVMLLAGGYTDAAGQ